MWNTLLYQPIVNALVFLNNLFGNFGLAIIVLTVLIRLLLIPLSTPSLKAAQKMKELAPELAKLKEKYGSDKKAFAQAQLELYRKHGANPAAGCLPQIIQFIILIALYQAFSKVLLTDGAQAVEKLNAVLYSSLKLSPETILNTKFLYLNLAKPDVFRLSGLKFPLPGVFLILAAFVQFLSSKMMQPAAKSAEKVAQKTPGKSDDLATSMQTQMLYLFPLMTIFIGFSFPSGLILYWFIFSFSSAIQQYFVSGWGGLTPWLQKLKLLK